jgi:hypothetical protein
VLAVELEDAKAESLRASSSDKRVLLNGEVLGPGDVFGRRTPLSHPRPEALRDGLVVLEMPEGWWSQREDVFTGPSPFGVRAASSLMTSELRDQIS